MARIRSRESASILHADLDSFFASVEQRDDPRLRGRPVIVGGGVVLAASYEAKAFGIRSAMGGRQASRLCPDALVVPPRFSAYVEASKRVFEIFDDTTPLVEGISIDEAFLDVAGLRRLVGEPEAIGAALRERVREEVGLPISVGIARTKYLAKVASAVSKPDGLLRVPPETETEFLHPLPVERLWGVGKVTAAKLHADGIRTIGELARREEMELTTAVGQAAGRHLWALANLRDPRPVVVGRRRSSIGSQSALGFGRRYTHDDLDARLAALVDRVARRLRGGERIGRTFTLRLRFDDLSRATRSATIPRSTASTATWLETGRRLLTAAMPMIDERGCTLIGITISGLVEAGADVPEQLELPLFAEEQRADQLDGVLDRVRDRFGSAAVTRAVLVGRHTGLEMPTLPDPGPSQRLR
jgi:DNA polymerase IV